MLFLFLIILLIWIICEFLFYNKEKFVNYKQCNNDNIHISLNGRIKRGLNDNYHNDNQNWDVFIPCGYTYAENDIKKIKFTTNKQSVFAIDGSDNIASKILLANLIKKRYGPEYSNYIPKSYSNEKTDLNLLLQNHAPNLKYIAKRDIQQQKGLQIIHSYKDIKALLNDKSYIIVQELLNNPFIINKRKINLRVYLLITCYKGKVSAYIHNNGFMYYTVKNFSYDSIDKDAHITTGYISRDVYKDNPLTLEDFYIYLDKNGYNSNTLKYNIKNLFEKIMSAINVGICNRKLSDTNLLFQLFGTDIAPDNNLNVKLIEINKGPDMGGKDFRDNSVKDAVIKDIFKTIGYIPNKNNGFIEVW